MATFVTEGTELRRGDGASPEVFTAVSQVRTLGPVGVQRGLIDVTNLSSSIREFASALQEGQEVNVEIQYDPGDAQHEGLRTDAQTANLIRAFQVEYQTSPLVTFDFNALVTNWSTNADIDNVYILSVTLKPTGSLTVTS